MRRNALLVLGMGTLAVLAGGCVEHRVVYVPAYQAQPVSPGQPAYTYQPQTAYSTPPGQPDSYWQTNAPAPAPTAEAGTQGPPPPAAQANPPVVAQAPPVPQVEVVPVAPGPEYVWAPGYWYWGPGGWVWFRGHYMIRPHPHAVWVGGHWARRGHGYIFVGGHWR